MILVNILFPVPFFFLVLLSLPFPFKIGTKIRSIILKIMDVILFRPIAGGLSLYFLCVLLSIILLVISTADTLKTASRLEESRDANWANQHRCNKWRSERNFWISLFSTSLWLILYRVQMMSKQINALKNDADIRDKRQ